MLWGELVDRFIRLMLNILILCSVCNYLWVWLDFDGGCCVLKMGSEVMLGLKNLLLLMIVVGLVKGMVVVMKCVDVMVLYSWWVNIVMVCMVILCWIILLGCSCLVMFILLVCRFCIVIDVDDGENGLGSVFERLVVR